MGKRIFRDKLLASTLLLIGVYYINRNIIESDSFYKFSYAVYQKYYTADAFLNYKFFAQEDPAIEKNRLEMSKQNYELANELIKKKCYNEAIVKLIHVLREDSARYQDAQARINLLEDLQLAYQHYNHDPDKGIAVQYIRSVLTIDPKNTDVLPLREEPAIIRLMGYPLKYPNPLAAKKWNAEFERYSYFKRTMTLSGDGTIELRYTSAPADPADRPVILTFKGVYKLTDEDGINGTWTASRLDDPTIKCGGQFTLMTGTNGEMPELCVWDQTTCDSFTGYYTSSQLSDK